MIETIVKCPDPDHKIHTVCEFLTCTHCGDKHCRFVDGPWPLMCWGIYGNWRGALCAGCGAALIKMMEEYLKGKKT